MLITMALVALPAGACEYLYGTWRSNVEESLAYALQQPDVPVPQLDFVRDAFGHMTITFSSKEIVIHQTDAKEIMVAGNRYPLVFEYEKAPVRYLTCTEQLIEVEFSYFGETKRYRYTPVDANLYWVSLDVAIGREYFRRLSD